MIALKQNKMNKKAVIILLSASLAFFVAGIILLNTERTAIVLGDTQMNVLSLKTEEDNYMMYIENAAKFALAEAIKLTPSKQEDFYTLCMKKDKECEAITKDFETAFRKHLNAFNKAYNQDLNNYEFKIKMIGLNGKEGIELVGLTNDTVVIKKGEEISYIIKPNFKIQASLDELNELSNIPETIALAFFNDLLYKFQKCSKTNQEVGCFCDETEINPNELPEGYKVSIITTTARENMLGNVEYQFKLLDPENKIVESEGKQMVKNQRGMFGAYEFFNEDVTNNLCYPGIFSLSRGYLIDKNLEKGKLYFFIGAASCKQVSKFSMVEFVKESEIEKVKGPYCSKIGVKS